MASKSGVEYRPTLDKVKAALRKKIRELPDVIKPNAKIAAFLDSWVQRNFQSEGGNVGGWAPFALGGRRILGGGIDTSAKLLQDTGALRASVRPFYDKEQVGIGSDLDRAKWHNEGTPRLPARQILPTREDVIEPILNIYNEHFAKVTKERVW